MDVVTWSVLARVRSRQPVWCGSLLLAVLATAPGALRAQVLQGEIDGTVKDASGALIPNAVVVLTNTDQRLEVRRVKTDSQGQFSAPLVPIGTYSVAVSAPGFKVFTVRGIEVHVGSPAVVPLALATGSVNEQVNVTADALGLQLDSAAAGTLIDTKQTTDLPLSSRNFFS